MIKIILMGIGSIIVSLILVAIPFCLGHYLGNDDNNPDEDMFAKVCCIATLFELFGICAYIITRVM